MYIKQQLTTWYKTGEYLPYVNHGASLIPILICLLHVLCSERGYILFVLRRPYAVVVKIQQLTSYICYVFSGILANATYSSDLNDCSFTCFDDVLFHWEIAVEDEAEVADDSSKLSIGMLREIVCGCCKAVLADDDEKRIASVWSLFSLSLFSSIQSPVCSTHSWSERTKSKSFSGDLEWLSCVSSANISWQYSVFRRGM